jgi:hypothetical protein
MDRVRPWSIGPGASCGTLPDECANIFDAPCGDARSELYGLRITPVLDPGPPGRSADRYGPKGREDTGQPDEAGRRKCSRCRDEHLGQRGIVRQSQELSLLVALRQARPQDVIDSSHWPPVGFSRSEPRAGLRPTRAAFDLAGSGRFSFFLVAVVISVSARWSAPDCIVSDESEHSCSRIVRSRTSERRTCPTQYIVTGLLELWIFLRCLDMGRKDLALRFREPLSSPAYRDNEMTFAPDGALRKADHASIRRRRFSRASPRR